LVELYLLSQVTAYAPANDSRWNTFISHLAPNISFTSNVAPGSTNGIANVTALLYAIGAQYQNISQIIVYPTNYVQSLDTGSTSTVSSVQSANPTGESVASNFKKQQRELSSGVFMDLEFWHQLSAIPTNDHNVCNVTLVAEYANFGNTVKSLPTLSGQSAAAWICQMFSILCNGHVPSFGSAIDNAPGVNDAGKCYYFWKDAPSLVQDDGPGGSGVIIETAYSLIAITGSLDVLIKNPDLAPYICPNLGAASFPSALTIAQLQGN